MIGLKWASYLVILECARFQAKGDNFWPVHDANLEEMEFDDAVSHLSPY